MLLNDDHQHSATTNLAIKTAKDGWIAFLDQDDRLHAHALQYACRQILDHPQTKIIYTDEDKLDGNGNFDPYLKPDWNPALLLSQNYFCHLLFIERAHLLEVGCLRIGYEGAQDWDLCLRATDSLHPHQIGHIRRILHHWRAHSGQQLQKLWMKRKLGSA